MDKKVKLEDELKELETIIKSLETGDLDLDVAIDKYTNAMQIAKSCSDKLFSAEEQINKVLTDSGKLEDFKLEDK